MVENLSSILLLDLADLACSALSPPFVATAEVRKVYLRDPSKRTDRAAALPITRPSIGVDAWSTLPLLGSLSPWASFGLNVPAAPFNRCICLSGKEKISFFSTRRFDLRLPFGYLSFAAGPAGGNGCYFSSSF